MPAGLMIKTLHQCVRLNVKDIVLLVFLILPFLKLLYVFLIRIDAYIQYLSI